jgi:hypothetical protein
MNKKQKLSDENDINKIKLKQDYAELAESAKQMLAKRAIPKNFDEKIVSQPWLTQLPNQSRETRTKTRSVKAYKKKRPALTQETNKILDTPRSNKDTSQLTKDESYNGELVSNLDIIGTSPNPNIKYISLMPPDLKSKITIRCELDGDSQKMTDELSSFTDFTITSASLGDVTTGALTITNFLGKIVEDETKKKRKDVANTWDKEIYNILNIQDEQHKSFVLGVPAIKAIMDSACLGEAVVVAIEKNICQSMKPLDTKIVNLYEEHKQLELLSFYLQLSYCDIFELVSSDILGAVNGLYTIEAIYNTLPCIGYVSIPKRSGGQIGTIDDVFMLTNILNFLFNNINKNTANKIPNVWSGQYKVIDNIIGELKREIISTFEKLYGDKTTLSSYFDDLLIDITQFRNFVKESNGGIFRGDDDFNIYLNVSIRIKEIIKLFSDIFEQLKQKSSYKMLYDILLASYGFDLKNEIKENENKKNPSIIIYHENFTWLSFQICRYMQTKSVFNVPEESISFDTIETKRVHFVNVLKESKRNFINKWHEILQIVYIHEAFAGHDNKSNKLTKLGIERFSGRLNWIDKYKSDEEIFEWDNIHQKLIKLIQYESRCMFFQYWPREGHRGTVFSMNSNMVSDKTIGREKTANDLPVCELFVYSIGEQIISAYDLENYEGETVFTEKAIINTINEELIENIVGKRDLNRIQEIQGIISTLDRASRTNHPYAYYCTGSLDIPIKVPVLGIKQNMTITITYEYGPTTKSGNDKSTNKYDFANSYSIYQVKPELNKPINDKINNLEGNKNLKILISFLINYNPENRKKFIDDLFRKKQILQKYIEPQTKNIRAGKFDNYMIELFNILQNPGDYELSNKEGLDILFNLVKKTIDMYLDNPDTWNERSGWLIGERLNHVGKSILNMFPEDEFTGIQKLDKIYKDILNGNFEKQYPQNNVYNVGVNAFLHCELQKELQEKLPVGEFPLITVAKMSEDGKTMFVPANKEQINKLINRVTNKNYENTAIIINNENEDKDSEMNVLSTLVMSNTEEVQEVQEQFNQNRMRQYTDGLFCLSNSLMNIPQIILNKFNVSQWNFSDVFKKLPYIGQKTTKTTKEQFNTNYLNLLEKIKNFENNKNEKLGLEILDDINEGIKEANYLKSNKLTKVDEDYFKKMLNKLYTYGKEFHEYLAELYNKTNNSDYQKGGAYPSFLESLIGKIVIVKYDYKKNIFYIGDYEKLFTLWLKSKSNEYKGIKDSQTNIPNKISTISIGPGGKTDEWWRNTGSIIRNNPAFKGLPQEQKTKKYQEIIKNLFKNIKTIENDEQLINKSINDALKYPPLLKTGLSYQEMTNIPFQNEFKQNQLISQTAGVTKRKKYKHKLTKRKINHQNKKTRHKFKKRKKNTRRNK